MTKTEIAASLRKVAADLREESETVDRKKLQKCAQVLIAARGLLQLNRMVKGAGK